MEEFKEYFDMIGLTNTYRERVGVIYNFYKEISFEPIQDIFISEHINEENLRVYEDLTFFSENYVMEAKNFVNTDDFDLDIIKNRIVRFIIKNKEYDFEEATDNSRMFLSFSLPHMVRAEYKASKENCDYLKKIFLNYVRPNLENINNSE